MICSSGILSFTAEPDAFQSSDEANESSRSESVPVRGVEGVARLGMNVEDNEILRRCSRMRKDVRR